jgi:murein DD-endopeptidase MepM/ murein hydrolase activator NlpD
MTKHKKTISEWLTSPHILIIRSEENLADKRTINFNYAKFFGLIAIILFLVIGFSLWLSTTILSRWYDPKITERAMARKLLNLNSSVDSLSKEIKRRDVYLETISAIIKGEKPDEATAKLNEAKAKETEKDFDLSADSLLRLEFENEKYQEGTFADNRVSTISSMYFFSPISGIISQNYNPEKSHFAVDIVSKPDEPVKSIADGTVIISNYTDDTGYVIAIQHNNGVLSVYKHNAVLFKKVGNFVRAGEIISIIGNSGELTTGPHLHFELWFSGNPVNPLDYIVF